jgi:DNA polymerase-3 subunit alpha
MHAGGVVVSSQPISQFAPIETAKDPNDPNGPRIQMIGYDTNDAADIGLIKLDVLGLKALSTIDDTLTHIKNRHGIEIDLHNMDYADANVFKMLSAGHTRGVFQCEAVPYTNLILKMGGVSSFHDLVASNALVRPGAMNTIGAEYISRKNGKSPVRYAHPDAEWFTNDTYGEVLYQEQVMLMMTELAGMSMSDANKVRKIIGKKKDVSEFEEFQERFIDGASQKVSKTVAKKLWKDFEAHAGYSFNKSHAVAYSMISYWTAWLKYHYPLEFMAATLGNETDPDKFTDGLIETKRLGIKVLLPNVNKSALGVEIQDDAIRLGLTSIKYISDNVGERIIAHRPYTSFQHLKEVAGTKGSGVNSRAVEAMRLIGAATFEDNPKRGDERDHFYEYLKIPAFETKDLDPVVRYKIRTFDEYEEKGVFPVLGMVRKIKRGEGWARVEMVDETGSAGIFAAQDIPLESGQMYAALVADNRIVRYMTIEELSERIDNEFTRYMYDECGEVPEDKFKVIAFRPYTTKAGKKMSYMVFLDHLGQLHHVMAFPRLYVQSLAYCQEGRIVDAEVVETDDGSKSVKEFKVGERVGV